MNQKIFSGWNSINVQIGQVIIENNLKNYQKSFSLYQKSESFPNNLVNKIFEDSKQMIDSKKLFPLLEYYIDSYQKFELPCVLVFFDINAFTQINYTYGKDIGDLIAKRIHNILIDMFPGNLFARVGPDEFLGISYGFNIVQIIQYLEYITSYIENYDWENEFKNNLFVSISAGIADLNENSLVIDGYFNLEEDIVFFNSRKWLTRAYLGKIKSKRMRTSIEEGPKNLNSENIKGEEIEGYVSMFDNDFLSPTAPIGWENEWRLWH